MANNLGPYPEYDKWLLRLMDAQRYKLRKNAHKGYLGDLPVKEIIEKLKAEVVELEDALSRGSEIESILEASDVANFALAAVIAAYDGRLKDVSTGTEGTEFRTQVVHCSSDQGTMRSGTPVLHDSIFIGGVVSLWDEPRNGEEDNSLRPMP
jgi:hypothetical protein